MKYIRGTIRLVIGLFFITFALAKFTNAETATVYTSYFPGVVADDPENPGVAYEIVTELFKIAGKDFKLVPLPWARAQDMAKRTPGCLIFPLSWTPTRDENYRWSVNILSNRTYFVTFNGVKMTSQNAFGKHIGVQLKSSWDNWLTENGYEKVYRVPGEGGELIKLLENNRIDAWYTDQIIAERVLKNVKNRNITYSDPIQVFRTFLATHKTEPYPHIDLLKKAMVTMRQSGKLDEIYKKYDIPLVR